MTHLITGIMLFFLILGALDYIIGNRYGLGEEFENGIMASGRLFLCMSGFMVIAPLIAKQLGPVIAPAFRMIGADSECGIFIISGLRVGRSFGVHFPGSAGIMCFGCDR